MSGTERDSLTEGTPDFTDEPLEGPPPLSPGRELAPGYAVLEHLHRSAKFDVYDVWSETRFCRCIAKTPIPVDPEDVTEQELRDFERSSRSLVREFRLLERLTHPHIVRAYELLRGESPVLVMETLTGQTLSHLMDTAPRRLPLADLTHLGLQLCSAVAYLHTKGVLHLDLKPSNVVSERGTAKLLDLSIARPPGPCRPGLGTLHYLSPEQARGGEVTAATDVWGVGATLFEAATDEPPFYADEESEEWEESSSEHVSGTGTARRADYEQLRRRADPVGRKRRLPREFSEAIDACLEPDPASRPTLRELARRLETFAGSRGY